MVRLLRILGFAAMLLVAAGAVALCLIVTLALAELATGRPTPLPRRIRALGRLKRRELRHRTAEPARCPLEEAFR